jgi:hypothetical protein
VAAQGRGGARRRAHWRIEERVGCLPEHLAVYPSTLVSHTHDQTFLPFLNPHPHSCLQAGWGAGWGVGWGAGLGVGWGAGLGVGLGVLPVDIGLAAQ